LLKFYYSLAPNPMKVALFLEEAGLPYDAIPVDTRKGDQFAPDYVALNPNSKVPCIVDGDAVVFDSNAILLYLGEKTGRFMPANTPALRGELLSWLMFVASGVGPYSGQAVHFTHHAPKPNDYAAKRYQFEAKRHYGILDMALWGWARMVPFILGEDAWAEMPHLKRLMDEVGARPAAARALALKDRHTFKSEMDDEARRNMFRHTIAA